MGPLSQAVGLGHRHVVSVTTQRRMLGYGGVEWQDLCRGTAVLVTAFAGTAKRAALPKVHVVSCGHVAMPHLFKELYNGADNGMLDGLRQHEVRVRVSIPSDSGEELVSAYATRDGFASSSIHDDLAVLHLGSTDERRLLSACEDLYGADTPFAADVSLSRPASATLEPSAADYPWVWTEADLLAAEEVAMPTFTALRAGEAQGCSATDLAADYHGVLQSLEERRGVMDPGVTLDRMVPTVFKGALVEENARHVAAVLHPECISANSGAPLFSAVDGSLLGILKKLGIPGHPSVEGFQAGTEEEQHQYHMLRQPSCPPILAFFTPQRKLRNLLQKIERHILTSAAKA